MMISMYEMTTIWWLSIKRLLARFNHHHTVAEAVTLTTIRSSAQNSNGPRCSSAVIVCVWTKSSSLSQRWAGGQRERAGGSRAEQWSIVGFFSYFTEKKCQATTKKCSITAFRCCLSLCSLFCIFYIFCIHNNFSTPVAGHARALGTKKEPPKEMTTRRMESARRKRHKGNMQIWVESIEWIINDLNCWSVALRCRCSYALGTTTHTEERERIKIFLSFRYMQNCIAMRL